ncbi:MAG: hypothetical protein RL425_518 [Pseudomonadota bacterium]
MMSVASPVTINLFGLSETAAAPAPLADAALFENLMMASALVVLPDGAAAPSPLAQPDVAVDIEAGVEVEPEMKDQEDPTLPDTLLALLGSTLSPAPQPVRATEAQDVAPPAATALKAAPTTQGRTTAAQKPEPARAPDTDVPHPAGPTSLSDIAPEPVPLPSAPVAPAARLMAQIPNAASAPADPQAESRLPSPLPNAVAQPMELPVPAPAPEHVQAPMRAITMPQSPWAEPPEPDAQKLNPIAPAASTATPMAEKIAANPATPKNPVLIDSESISAPTSPSEEHAPPAAARSTHPAQPHTPSASISQPPSISSSQTEGLPPMQVPMDVAPMQVRDNSPSVARVALPISPALDTEPVKVEGPAASPSPFVLPGIAAPADRPITAPQANVLLAQTSAAPLELSPDLAFLDRLSAEISDMAREGGKLHFRLTPAHLGKLDIAVEALGDTVSVHMQTQSPEAKSILTDAQSGLTQDLAARGLRLTETTVSLAGDDNLPRRNQPLPEMMVETETPSEADAGSPITARSSGRFA